MSTSINHHRTASPKKDHENAWSVANFESERPHMVTFIRENLIPYLDDEECRRIGVRAPVKSGKREIVEYLAQRDKTNNPIHLLPFLVFYQHFSSRRTVGRSFLFIRYHVST